MNAPEMRARLVPLAMIALVAACTAETVDTPPCDSRMIATGGLRSDAAFQGLRYHTHIDFHVARGVAYDLWGDEKFEYRTGLEFSLVPVKKPRSHADLCVNAASLRIILPADERQRNMLRVFVRSLAGQAGLDAAALDARVNNALAAGGKYRMVISENNVDVQAGKLVHPNRGDFFMVSFAVPRP